MKYLFFASIIIAFAGCKTGEGMDNEYSNLRMDGFYMAKSLFASTAPDTINGTLVPRTVINLLRFYNSDSGVIIPDAVSQNFKMTNSANNLYYQWCENYEIKNPGDKEFVNFKFRLYSKDSIKFSQLTHNTKIDYVGKIYKDSMALMYVIHPLAMGEITPLPPRPVNFKFYPKVQ